MKRRFRLFPAIAALALTPVLALQAQTAEDEAKKAKPMTEEEIAADASKVQATPAGTFSTKKRTVGKDGKITEHDTSKKLKVSYEDHGDAGAAKDEEEKAALIEKMQKAKVKSSAEGDLPKKDEIPTARKAGEPAAPAAATTEDGVKVAKAVPAKADGGTEVEVQQGETAKKVKLTADQKRKLEEQLRQKKATEAELREQRDILNKTPDTDQLKNPTLKKRGSFTR